MSSSPTPIPDDLARTCWDDSADAWDHFVESGLDYHRVELHGPALLDACRPVHGCKVLDLGCGQGWFSRQLASRGAVVTGVDWSARLVEHARRHEARAPLGVAFEVMDAAQVASRFGAGSFDLATGCMSIMDMPDPGEVLKAARAVVRPGGRVVFSVPQPVTDATFREWERDPSGRKLALKLNHYFDATPTMLEWKMKRLTHHFTTVQYRHTLEQWSRMIESAGLLIARLREPRPSPEALARHPALEDAARLPYFLIFDCRAA